MGTLWLGPLFPGEVELPSAEQMDAGIEHMRNWKREHIRFEPSRSCATSTRYQQ